MNTKWGRTESEWDELVEETIRFLGEKAKLRQTTTYSELNYILHRRTGAKLFDFNMERDRAAVGALLGEASERMLPVVGAMVSSIVLYLDANDAGTGFYKLAKQLGLLTDNSKRLEFWTDQVNSVFDFYHR